LRALVYNQNGSSFGVRQLRNVFPHKDVFFDNGIIQVQISLESTTRKSKIVPFWTCRN
jgi:hypothetical protein